MLMLQNHMEQKVANPTEATIITGSGILSPENQLEKKTENEMENTICQAIF